MFVQSKICIFALVALASLFDGFGIGTIGFGLMVHAAPTPRKHGAAAQNVKFRRQDAGDGDADTLGRLIRDYNSLKAAVPAGRFTQIC